MLTFIPAKKQWKNWSLPSKLTAIGAYIGILSISLWVGEKAVSFYGDLDKKNDHIIEQFDEPIAFRAVAQIQVDSTPDDAAFHIAGNINGNKLLIPCSKAIYLRLTNVGEKPTLVVTLDIEKRDSSGVWTRGDIVNTKLGTLIMMRAHPLELVLFQDALELLDHKTITVGESIQGWLFTNLSGSESDMRLVIEDAFGNVHFVPLIVPNTKSSGSNIQPAEFKAGKLFNITDYQLVK